MRLGGIAERDLAIDSQSQFPLRDPREDIALAPQKLFALSRVVGETRTREIRAVFREARGIEQRNRTARLSEKREQAAAHHTIEALIECRLPDRVVDDIHALSTGQ